MARVNYYGQAVEIDSQGRVLLPQMLREEANAVGEVVVVGAATFLQVANREDYRRNMDENPLTVEDEQALSDLGL
jgi:MraZ protein